MKINYRPEIDGLRAIAVIAVIFYHAKINFFGYHFLQGGFIGVDIFFVISGYLITLIILKELIVSGTFQFKYFYERRARRILPALLFMILLSIPVAYIYLLPNSFVDFSKSIFYILGFNSNFYFYNSRFRYGDEDGLFKPFLNTWSLSLEEQYYIFFPIILVFIFKYLRKYLLIILAIVLTTSLILANTLSKDHASFNFYFAPTRCWEFIVGSLLAILEINLRHRSQNRIINEILSIVGLVLVFYSFIFFNDKMFHPSFYTILPVLGVSLLIYFLNTEAIITKILSSKLFVSIGLISYSLYLFHYPIFAFVRIKEFPQNELFNLYVVAAVIVLILLSILSYYFIEKPARNQKYKFKSIFLLIIIFSTLIIIFSYSVIKNNGFEKRFFITSTYSLSSLRYEEESKKFEIDFNYDNYLNYSNINKNVLIVGNSHAEDLAKVLSFSYLKNNFYFNLVSPKNREDNYNYQARYFYDYLTSNISKIDYFSDNFIEHLDKQYKNSQIIILATSWNEEDYNSIEGILEILKKDNKKLIIFDNALNSTLYHKLYKFNRLDYFVFKEKKLPNSEELKKIEKLMYNDLQNKKVINEIIYKIAKKNLIKVIKREDIFCNKLLKKCPVLTKEGYKIYYDYGHLTNEGAKFFSEYIEKNKLFLQYLNSIDLSN
jgi:peptidoglycan/LPS O-acetylase OafA/YrhL